MQFEYIVPVEHQGAPQTGALIEKLFPEAVRTNGMNAYKLPNGDKLVGTWRRIVHFTRKKSSPLQALGGTPCTM